MVALGRHEACPYIDLPGVNAQEKSREKLIESLRIGAEDMFNTPIEPEKEEELVTIEV